MARLPSVESLGQRPTPASSRPIVGIDGSAVPRAVQGLGKVLGEVGEQYAREQDAQAVFAARRALDDWERATVYDPQNGAISKRGADAFGLPKTLPSQFDEAANKIGASLTSQRQREAFQQLTQSRREQIGAWADRHALQQREVYEAGQYEADLTSFANRAAMLAGADQFDTAKGEVAAMQVRTVGYLRGKGRSEEEIAQAVKNNTSRVNVAIVSQLLEADRPVDADKYLKENSAGMNTEDLLKASAAVGKQMDARTAMMVASEAVKAAKPAVQPTDMDRLTNIIVKLESGGNPDAVSPKGAKGLMQVMDATNKDPGFGVVPARDDSPQERARVGRDYLAAMVKEFGGDVLQATAAYNAGPAAVKKAIKESPDWLSKLPQETQAYVMNVGKQYGDGGGAPSMPTLEQVLTPVRQALGDKPHLLKLAADETKRRYEELVKAKKDEEEQAEAGAMQWLASNGGRFSQMPASLRANLPPKSVDNVMAFGQKIAKGDDITDPIVFQKLAGDENFLKGLTDAQFFGFRKNLSESDFQYFAKRRGELTTGAKGQKPSDLDIGGVDKLLNNRLQQMGIDPSPKDGSKDAARVGAIRKAVWDNILNAQMSAGKKFNDAEITNRVDELFTKSVTFQNTFLGIKTGTSQQRLLDMKPGDIPDDVRERLKADFKRQGIEPTEADLLGAYFHIKLAQPRNTTGSF